MIRPALSRRPHFGLRARITFIYALGALLVAGAVAFASFALVQRVLLEDFEEAARAQLYRNARQVRSNLQNQSVEVIQAALAAPEEDVPEEAGALDLGDILGNLLKPNGADDLLVLQNEPRSSRGLELRSIPSSLESLVKQGGAGQQRAIVEGQPKLVSGTYIAQLDAEYYEAASLETLQSTLDQLGFTLIAVALAGGVAGAALGYYSTRRALQPVVRVSNAAQAIATGDFRTRLDPTVDPDLAPLTASFNDMVGALEARIQRDERFASDVSHELRSPLMTLAASVGVLEHRREELSDQAQQAVDLLGKDLRRFTRLVEDLLEISRMDGVDIHADLAPVVLAEFLHFAVQQSRTPEVPVLYDQADAGLIVMAEKRRLAQVIHNLLDNALKYAGGATSVSFSRTGDLVRIAIDDNGPGVPAVDRERIFDRFTRAGADAGRRDVAKGVGLGLSLVAEHVRLHEGRVWVTDRTRGTTGARFVVELPVGDSTGVDEEMAI